MQKIHKFRCHKRVTASDGFEQNYNNLNVTECHDTFNTKNGGCMGVGRSYSTMSTVTSACF